MASCAARLTATGGPTAAAAVFDEKFVSNVAKAIMTARTTAPGKPCIPSASELPSHSAAPVSSKARPSAMLAATSTITLALKAWPNRSNFTHPVASMTIDPASAAIAMGDRQGVGWGERVYVRVDAGGGRRI